MIGVFGDATQAEVTKHLKTQLAGWVTQGERKRSPEAAFAAEGARVTWSINPT